MIRVVLDTNTVVSALLFSGIASRLVPLWQTRRIAVYVSREILREYLRVLAYPKFRLTDQDIRLLVEEELLPFVETIRVRRHLAVVRRDPDEDEEHPAPVEQRPGAQRREEADRERDQEQVERSVDQRPNRLQGNEPVERQLGHVHHPLPRQLGDEDVERDHRGEHDHGQRHAIGPARCSHRRTRPRKSSERRNHRYRRGWR